MKKKLFLGLLAAAAVSFTACQKDEVLNEVQQDEAISFSTYLGRSAQTKGSIVEEDDLQGLGFGVFAYYTGEKTMAEYAAASPGIPATPNFMNNEKVYMEDWDNDNSTNETWGYSNTKYWPNTTDEKISFYAYGPYDDPEGASNAIAITTAAAEKPKLTYTVSEEISEHMDVLFAPAQENKTKATGTVPFAFQHALSRIEFEVKTAADYSRTATINLNSVSLTGNFYPSGTLSLGGSNVDWTEATAENKTFTITDTREVTNAPRTVQTTAGSTEYIMIIPQVFEQSALSMSISYNQIISSTSTPVNITKEVNPDNTFTFEAGKAYKFIISIGMNEVKFSATVTPWVETHNGFNPGTSVTF